MAKKFKAIVRLQITAGKANPAPPIGPALAGHGINIMAFCKEYNARTQNNAGDIIPAEITVYTDGSFTFILKSSPASILLKKAAGVESGSDIPNREKVGKVTRAQIREIAEVKMKDMNAIDIEGAMRQIEGTARNMGITASRNRFVGGCEPPACTTKEIKWQNTVRNIMEALSKINVEQNYDPRTAVTLAKETSYAKFDATIEVHMRMGLDPRQADQQVRDVVVLPNGLGKTVRVLVFAQGDGATKAHEGGADFVADTDEMINKIAAGWTDFDVAIATPDMMGKVGKLGRVLGPRSLMPNPKAGTVCAHLKICRA